MASQRVSSLCVVLDANVFISYFWNIAHDKRDSPIVDLVKCLIRLRAHGLIDLFTSSVAVDECMRWIERNSSRLRDPEESKILFRILLAPFVVVRTDEGSRAQLPDSISHHKDWHMFAAARDVANMPDCVEVLLVSGDDFGSEFILQLREECSVLVLTPREFSDKYCGSGIVHERTRAALDKIQNSVDDPETREWKRRGSKILRKLGFR